MRFPAIRQQHKRPGGAVRRYSERPVRFPSTILEQCIRLRQRSHITHAATESRFTILRRRRSGSSVAGKYLIFSNMCFLLPQLTIFTLPISCNGGKNFFLPANIIYTYVQYILSLGIRYFFCVNVPSSEFYNFFVVVRLQWFFQPLFPRKLKKVNQDRISKINCDFSVECLKRVIIRKEDVHFFFFCFCFFCLLL